MKRYRLPEAQAVLCIPHIPKLTAIFPGEPGLASFYSSGGDETHGNPPQGNQELFVVKDKVGRPQVSFG